MKVYDFRNTSPQFQFTCYRTILAMFDKIGKRTKIYSKMESLKFMFEPRYSGPILLSEEDVKLMKRWMLSALGHVFEGKEIQAMFEKEMAAMLSLEVLKELGD